MISYYSCVQFAARGHCSSVIIPMNSSHSNELCALQSTPIPPYKPEPLTSTMFYEISSLFSVLVARVCLSVSIETLDPCQYETTVDHDNSRQPPLEH